MTAEVPSVSGARPTAASQAPFFILGCVRSGTTMLRNVLRCHPNLACPEETHFFRWSDPFGTEACRRTLSNNVVLQRHRQIDGITEAEFAHLLETCQSRIELCERYMQLYMARRKPGAKRWFDKTPQNVYGAGMLAAWPGATFIHIVRDPEDVVASLRLGKVVKIESLIGAVNYWNESIDMIRTLRRAYPRRVYEVRYEDFVGNPEVEIAKMCEFLGEPFDYSWFKALELREVSHDSDNILNAQEKAQVRRLCMPGRRFYGFVNVDAGESPAQGPSLDKLKQGQGPKAAKAAKAARKGLKAERPLKKQKKAQEGLA